MTAGVVHVTNMTPPGSEQPCAQERYSFEVTMPGGHAFVRRDPWARETEFETEICTVINPADFTWTSFERLAKVGQLYKSNPVDP